jgi:enoyl-CoA hydratase
MDIHVTTLAEAARDLPSLRFEHPSPGVVCVVLDAPGLNAVDAHMHRDLARVWTTLDTVDDVRAILVRGAGKAFSAGGNFDLLAEMSGDAAIRDRVLDETRAIVLGLLNCSKPIVSAVRGPVAGAGLAIALLADVSVVSSTAKVIDGHTRLGVTPGDHAVLCWPLLCGMAKTKYYLLTSRSLSGAEAERIGLFSLAVDDERVQATAESVAAELAGLPTPGLAATKSTLNLWYRAQLPAFEAALAEEFRLFATPDVAATIEAIRAQVSRT